MLVLLRIVLGGARREERHGGAAWAARALPVYLAAALLGHRLPRALAAVRAGFWLAACRLGRTEERRYRAYSRASSALILLGVLDHAAASMLPAAPEMAVGESVCPADLPDAALVGSHAPEHWTAVDERPSCRWTYPLALLRFRLEAGDYRLRLEMSSPVAPERRALRVFFNGKLAPAATDGSSFALLRGSFCRREQLLAISCAPFYPAKAGPDDPRELGVALFALRFDRLPRALAATATQR